MQFLKNLGFLVLGLGTSLFVLVFALAAIGALVGWVCFAGAIGVVQATNSQFTCPTTHRYPPIIVNVTTPDGKTLEATAEFEDEAEQQQ